MAIDAYIKFGEDTWIQGDSYDASHYFWCELRSCGIIDLKPNDKGSDTGAAASTAAAPKPQFDIHRSRP